jgi:hypothetical protein
MLGSTEQAIDFVRLQWCRLASVHRANVLTAKRRRRRGCPRSGSVVVLPSINISSNLKLYQDATIDLFAGTMLTVFCAPVCEQGYNPELPNGGLPAPDPERWLPKWQRSEFRKKKLKSAQREKAAVKGSQVRGLCAVLLPWCR